MAWSNITLYSSLVLVLVGLIIILVLTGEEKTNKQYLYKISETTITKESNICFRKLRL